MLSFNWKIFRIVSYLHMTCTLVIGAFMIYILFSTPFKMNSTEDVLVVLTLILCPSILLANSSINIYLLERFYPDKPPGKKLHRFSVILFILSLVVTIIAAALAVTGFYELAAQKNFNFQQQLIGYLTISTIAVIGLTGFYILWNQVSLRKRIRRNYEASLNNFLDSDQS